MRWLQTQCSVQLVCGLQPTVSAQADWYMFRLQKQGCNERKASAEDSTIPCLHAQPLKQLHQMLTGKQVVWKHSYQAIRFDTCSVEAARAQA